MKKKIKILVALALTLSLMILATMSVSAGTDSTTFTNGRGSLSVSSTSASASTVNTIPPNKPVTGNDSGYYAYVKATLEYTNGDWDVNWNDGLGSASAYVTRYPGFTVSYGTGTHSVRNSQQANGGTSTSGSTRANP